jgi:hypothetical protein
VDGGYASCGCGLPAETHESPAACVEALWREAIARAAVRGAWDYDHDLVDVLMRLATVAERITDPTQWRAALERLRALAEAGGRSSR